SASQFTEQKQKDDFRLLSQGLKNLTIVTYDELLTRSKNDIEVLDEFSRKMPSVPYESPERKRATILSRPRLSHAGRIRAEEDSSYEPSQNWRERYSRKTPAAPS